MKGSVSGFALVTAIFLLVVLAALGVFMVTLSGTHQAAPRHSILATRVYFGAKAGLDWGIQQAVAVNNCALSPATTTTTFPLTGTGLSGVDATVTCSRTAHNGGNVYRITSTAVTATGTFGTLDYAQRRMEATVSDIP
jgi:MSHA biogenesis protein MshP